jgi:hypothetical protein
MFPWPSLRPAAGDRKQNYLAPAGEKLGRALAGDQSTGIHKNRQPPAGASAHNAGGRLGGVVEPKEPYILSVPPRPLHPWQHRPAGRPCGGHRH